MRSGSSARPSMPYMICSCPAGGGLGDVGEEVEEVVGLPVEPERVEAPEHERGVAEPRVAVVPVALAARRLRQRGRGGGDQRAGGRVGEALERERAALQVAAPRVVGEVAAGEPVLPVVRRPHEPPVGLVVGLRRRVLAPGERDVQRLALLHQVPRGGARALDAEVEVGRELQLDVAVGGAARRLVVAVARVLPAAALEPVVERRLAAHRDLHLADGAADGPQQHVVGVVVGGRAAVRVRAVPLVVPGADQQHVAHDDPAARRVPARLQHERPGQVAAVGGHLDARRAEPERARAAVQDRAEHARRVHPRQAQPLDVPARRDERGRLAVGQEAVGVDRRERAATVVAGVQRRHVAGESTPSRRGLSGRSLAS